MSNLISIIAATNSIWGVYSQRKNKANLHKKFISFEIFQNWITILNFADSTWIFEKLNKIFLLLFFSLFFSLVLFFFGPNSFPFSYLFLSILLLPIFFPIFPPFSFFSVSPLHLYCTLLSYFGYISANIGSDLI